MAQVSEFISWVQKLACPSTVVSSGELALSHRIDCICADYTKQKALKTLAQHPLLPALYQYVSDGWSALTNMIDTTRVNEKLVRRSGKTLVEYCLERGFVKVDVGGDQMEMHMAYSRPRPLLEGKKLGTSSPLSVISFHVSGIRVTEV